MKNSERSRNCVAAAASAINAAIKKEPSISTGELIIGLLSIVLTRPELTDADSEAIAEATISILSVKLEADTLHKIVDEIAQKSTKSQPVNIN